MTRPVMVLRGDASRALSGLLACALAFPLRVSAGETCELHFHHTHTDEHLTIVNRSGAGYVPEALDQLSRFLTDFRTHERMPMDPGLFDILCEPARRGLVVAAGRRRLPSRRPISPTSTRDALAVGDSAHMDLAN